MENEVSNIKKREEIVRKVAIMKQKRAWLHYEEKLKDKQDVRILLIILDNVDC